MLSVSFPVDLSDKFKYASYSTVCIVCLKCITDCTLLKCSSCKLVFYCSKEHQKQHWPNHKQVCKVVQTLLKNLDVICLFENYENEGYERWKRFRLSLINACETLMKRKLCREERGLFLNPRTCKVCYTHKQSHMITCKDCGVISYCSEAHKLDDGIDHSRECHKLKFCLDFDTYCRKPFFVTLDISDANALPQDMQTFVDKFVNVTTKPHIDDIYISSYLSNSLSLPLTLIYAIEKSEIYKNKDTFVIHVVGSGDLESSAWWCWEYIFHYFKMLSKINLVFVGPESTKEFCRPVLSCHDCLKSRSLNVIVYNGLYHEYVKNTTQVPDIIVVFNCGFHENESNNTWKNSLPVFFDCPGKIILFTSYTEEESKEDLKYLEKHSKKKMIKIIECKDNPFKSLLPFQDWFSEKNSVFYNNNFMNVVKT